LGFPGSRVGAAWLNLFECLLAPGRSGDYRIHRHDRFAIGLQLRRDLVIKNSLRRREHDSAFRRATCCGVPKALAHSQSCLLSGSFSSNRLFRHRSALLNVDPRLARDPAVKGMCSQYYSSEHLVSSERRWMCRNPLRAVTTFISGSYSKRTRFTPPLHRVRAVRPSSSIRQWCCMPSVCGRKNLSRKGFPRSPGTVASSTSTADRRGMAFGASMPDGLGSVSNHRTAAA
jgi:hypothetical protein